MPKNVFLKIPKNEGVMVSELGEEIKSNFYQVGAKTTPKDFLMLSKEQH